ncbi:MAG: tetratricopeptide repeat protein [Bacteroidales bacterium]|nr:tetratricopeptide repeat protein [Bacteroidales bacterium]
MIRIRNRTYRNSAVVLCCLGFLLVSELTVSAQADRKHLRQGNREYAGNKFAESEISYRRASDINKTSPDAVFNTGDALYRQNKFDDAAKEFLGSSGKTDDVSKKAAAFYNLGNSLLMAQKIGESIEAYKNSLRLDPDNMEAKYNLAYAQDLLEQQKQQQQDKDDNKNDDQNKNDQQNEQDKNQDQEKQGDQDKEQANQDNSQQKQDDDRRQQDQQGISREDAERLLNAIANDEKEVQEKVKEAKAAKARVKTLKNW